MNIKNKKKYCFIRVYEYLGKYEVLQICNTKLQTVAIF